VRRLIDASSLSEIDLQETERLIADPAPGISAVPHEDNLRYFDVAITGPDGSPFERELR
jgi:ubiquitin-conjugating enzyme E2 N